jgi:acylphosphatase
MRCVKITISGIVQGVGYRYFCYKKATEYGISGYARNLYNGDVEVSAQGEERFINDFIKELNMGSPHSAVKSLKIQDIECKNEYSGFSIY